MGPGCAPGRWASPRGSGAPALEGKEICALFWETGEEGGKETIGRGLLKRREAPEWAL